MTREHVKKEGMRASDLIFALLFSHVYGTNLYRYHLLR